MKGAPQQAKLKVTMVRTATRYIYRSGPFKHRASNNRQSELTTRDKEISKTISAGSQLSAVVRVGGLK